MGNLHAQHEAGRALAQQYALHDSSSSASTCTQTYVFCNYAGLVMWEVCTQEVPIRGHIREIRWVGAIFSHCLPHAHRLHGADSGRRGPCHLPLPHSCALWRPPPIPRPPADPRARRPPAPPACLPTPSRYRVPEECPAEVRDLIVRCLSVDASARPTMEEIIATLKVRLLEHC